MSRIRTCWCGAPVYNGHHCENGHLQDRGGRRDDELRGSEERFQQRAGAIILLILILFGGALADWLSG